MNQIESKAINRIITCFFCVSMHTFTTVARMLRKVTVLTVWQVFEAWKFWHSYVFNFFPLFKPFYWYKNGFGAQCHQYIYKPEWRTMQAKYTVKLGYNEGSKTVICFMQNIKNTFTNCISNYNDYMIFRIFYEKLL